VKSKILFTIGLCLVFLMPSINFLTACSVKTSTYAITIESVTGGMATVSTNETNSHAAPGSTVTISIAIPNQSYEGQTNHRFKSITVTGTHGDAIPSTQVSAGQSYTFKMPDEAVDVAVALELDSLAVYLQDGHSGTPILVKTYSQAEMEAMATPQTQYYTGLDEVAPVQGKGTGVLLSTLIANLKQYNSSVEFVPNSTLVVSAADGYSMSFEYDYLLGSGAPRYYYPDLTSTSSSMADAVRIEPMFMINSYQARNLTRAQLDTKNVDTVNSYLFCFGLNSFEVTNQNDTVNQFAKWVDKINIILPGAAN